MTAGTSDTSLHARFGFIGPGRVGATLAEALHAVGLPVVSMFGRDASRSAAVAARVPGLAAAPSPQGVADAATVVFLTVTDDAIDGVCTGVRWRPEHSVVHCSGARELDALQAAADAGARVGSFHPLQMFATPAAALATLPGCTVAIDGEPSLAALLHDTALKLRCKPIRLPAGRRAMYHASAYYVGPFLIALMQEAAAIWRALGLTEREAIDALAPLLHGTVAAVMEGGLAAGMAGCIARGDVGTVERHVAALDAFSPEAGALYRQLARRTIPLGIARGTLSGPTAERIRAALEPEQHL
jgi:predicted short-subunit dehydrogenase-like oxidoreductase (DUF2520 family)